MEIKKVGVIGAGQMGNGIAHVCALSGFEVLLNDVSKERMEAGLATNLVIGTDRRSYHLELRSTASAWTPVVSWRYPPGELIAHPGRLDNVPEVRGAEQDIPEREEHGEVAAAVATLVPLADRVVQPVPPCGL